MQSLQFSFAPDGVARCGLGARPLRAARPAAPQIGQATARIAGHWPQTFVPVRLAPLRPGARRRRLRQSPVRIPRSWPAAGPPRTASSTDRSCHTSLPVCQFPVPPTLDGACRLLRGQTRHPTRIPPLHPTLLTNRAPVPETLRNYTTQPGRPLARFSRPVHRSPLKSIQGLLQRSMRLQIEAQNHALWDPHRLQDSAPGLPGTGMDLSLQACLD